MAVSTKWGSLKMGFQVPFGLVYARFRIDMATGIKRLFLQVGSFKKWSPLNATKIPQTLESLHTHCEVHVLNVPIIRAVLFGVHIKAFGNSHTALALWIR